MLRILIEGQDAFKHGQEALQEEIAILREEMKKGFKKTHERLDKQGKQLAYLEDDAPTREEHDSLVTRVTKLKDTYYPRRT